MMSKEAMKLALEALVYASSYCDTYDAITALREALANEALDKMAENAKELGLDYEPAQQEPEWYHFVRYGEDCFVPYSGQAPEKATPLYTSPPAQRKPWAGLTDEDIQEVRENCGITHHAIKTIEAKLKEKNT